MPKHALDDIIIQKALNTHAMIDNYSQNKNMKIPNTINSLEHIKGILPQDALFIVPIINNLINYLKE